MSSLQGQCCPVTELPMVQHESCRSWCLIGLDPGVWLGSVIGTKLNLLLGVDYPCFQSPKPLPFRQGS